MLVVAQRTFPSLQHVSASDVVLIAPIPGYPDPEPVELSPEVWTAICHNVHKVTITPRIDLESGISRALVYPRRSITDLIFPRC